MNTPISPNPFESLELTEIEWKALEATARLRDPRRVAAEVFGNMVNVRQVYGSIRAKVGCKNLDELMRLVEIHGLPARPRPQEASG